MPVIWAWSFWLNIYFWFVSYDKECEKMLGVLLKLAKIAIWTTQSWQKYKSTPDFYSVE